MKFTSRRNGEEIEIKNFGTDSCDMSALYAELAARPGGERLILHVGAHSVLERDIILPMCHDQAVDGLLRFEMDRFTPFRADELIWTSKITTRDHKRNRLLVRLIIVPRYLIKSAIDLLSAAGRSPIALEARSSDGIRVIPLARGEVVHSGTAPSGWKRRLVSIALALTVLSEPILYQMLYIHYLQYKQAEIEPEIRAFDLLLQQANAPHRDARAVARERQRFGDILEALAVVSEVLPDDTYLTEFTMLDRKITLVGVSDSASRLIGLLAADSRIGNPAFTAPITRQGLGVENTSGRFREIERDVYTIQAEILER